MRYSSIAAVTLVTALTACNGGFNSVPAEIGSSSPLSISTMQLSATSKSMTQPTAAQLGLWPFPGPASPVCGAVSQGYARCNAWIRTDITGMLRPDTPAGFGPSALQTAYGLKSASGSKGHGETIAIVDAFHNPNAFSDVTTYRSQFGLFCKCTFQQARFTNQTNDSWAVEESLDVDMVSAICPKCNILLVEAKTSSLADFSTAEKYATAHANYVSNSWSGDEGTKTFDRDFNVSGVAITASTADYGYNQKDGSKKAQWPAILPTVIAVGGTRLSKISPRTESAWSGAGSGCSKIYAKPSFQHDRTTGCSLRAQADVSAEADPDTGVAVFDSFHNQGWLVVGGTSASAPMIASVFALANNKNTNNPGRLYFHASNLNDIMSGSNGNCGKPLCTAGRGWDGPTGLGTPNTIAAF
jgi:subtilase family serine protease